ncbi:hypothetical protein F9P46_23695 [Salmonella enterica subsp. enterica]|nr:hypothetical protein [Salmonella enterica subsp. enterica serovar Alachua]EDU9877029.1 hypothetical protein [Salmonella enterica subsp. enterica]EDC3937411.1 hypothetical protein [Salmonella enterica subsp. enterica serovar Alachua]EDM8934295.1 hypothetical protein [Salmonella enterica subsp. enterica serovar Alachua]EDY7338091.1 hypothetical protein [Salmonella enterica subsp. enterica serovar Alachua]
MNLVGISYNFNFFTKNNSIKADSESIYKLMPFINDGFMPTTADEISEEGDRYKVIRVQKENADVNISITFAKKAILVQITKEKEIEAVNLMGLVSSTFAKLRETLGEIKGERAACIANAIIENDQETEERIYKKFFTDEPSYFEWSVRRANKFVIEGEESNCVLAVNKGLGTKQYNGTGSISQIEVIVVSCDNNTIAENNTPRFEVNNTTIFNELLNKTKQDLDKIIGD